ncbi:uncharacterized protein SPPG_03046 [Spizellomyces punctatus DAOM BR117]|uniref:Peroxin/Ferlin domain-containing protein n=1 Tax=Spizellomyces punctatus (strain DAOM BR117) TaxID=645134 RepID=A0A0L0HP73_SPIPD|nr:uncharacterized protein SPPG_03046 [Spizellomyces punctatus DAOM BR117]KND02589.1 hypothetical protein SPPG_03046 [Spizellomyces punctatus DAOM BR117]|eukprot:XP_016610628.1 hypothetical protein SPPG_03046 [Spizellomyces punctatus DAOM BR117]
MPLFSASQRASSARTSNAHSGSLSNLVHRVLVNTAKEQDRQEQQPPSPPLNLVTTTPWNATRLIVRLGPVVETYENLEAVVRWKDPVKTVIWMIAWCALCYYPTLLCISPNLFIIVIILRNFYRRQREDQDNPPPTPPPVTSWSTSIAVGSEPYLKNMQFLQNVMTVYCDAYDKIVGFLKDLTWTDTETTSSLLQYALASIPLTWLVYFTVPFNYLLIFGGLLMFLHTTTQFRAVHIAWLPVMVLAVIKRYLTTLLEALRGLEPFPPLNKDNGMVRETDKVPSVTEVPVTVAVFENQRWWAGPGWIPHLLPTERPPWSDSTGKIVCPTLADHKLPGPGWAWADLDWKVDADWMPTDTEGWVYSDHNWLHPSGQPGLVSLTRRRRWVRSMHPPIGGMATGQGAGSK